MGRVLFLRPVFRVGLVRTMSSEYSKQKNMKEKNTGNCKAFAFHANAIMKKSRLKYKANKSGKEGDKRLHNIRQKKLC